MSAAQTTVVTFAAAEADRRIARFVDWAGDAAVEDLGVLDGRRRYRVPSAAWGRYTRAVSPRQGRRR